MATTPTNHNSDTSPNNSTKVKLSDMPPGFAGGTNELTEPQRAQIRMTYWVLAGAAVLLTLSGGAYVFAENGVSQYADDVRRLCSGAIPENITEFCMAYTTEKFSVQSSAAKEIFDFCKSFIPPVVTLVLGAHYVTRSSENN